MNAKLRERLARRGFTVEDQGARQYTIRDALGPMTRDDVSDLLCDIGEDFECYGIVVAETGRSE